ncbi:hypothetical protein DOTSEDRAFT_126730 [Dothistroma septosporum NZE10]|uniref:Non-homologous end-joining factor 1 n=1 Tax=Dothistroma septosporum (strain NZE10 / CBS 128990) TaxID=675120 RepID=N1PVA9_DOTSN|nr:hypothetical protein DOTSEDRAFT_126730 [Dothistroma septosporum NZE10]
MVSPNTWKLLDFGQDLPRLLVKTRFDEEGYEIQLTDLSRIWGETLKYNAIVERAAEERCSIDPSENDQYQILLDKIDGSFSGAKGTTLELHYEDGENDLSLDLSAPLPGCLPPLKWMIRFEQRRQSDIAEELVKPLLQQANRLRHQIQFLVDEVTAKDRVIGKITDRLESSGNDLTTVFPGVSNIKPNRKRSQKQQLAAHVEGLADFDEATWRASILPKFDHFEVSPTLLNDILADLPAPGSSEFKENAREEWWEAIGRGKRGNVERGAHNTSCWAKRGGGVGSVQPKLSNGEGAEDDDFQKQETPPHLNNRSRDALADDDETEDEDDLDALGAIGGRKASPTPSKIDGPLAEESLPPRSKQRAMLGPYGGKKKSSTPETEDEEPVGWIPKPKSKLGAFGGRAKEPATRKVDRLSEEATMDETPEHRANKKRERLRKEMQNKHPVKKKKRKF